MIYTARNCANLTAYQIAEAFKDEANEYIPKVLSVLESKILDFKNKVRKIMIPLDDAPEITSGEPTAIQKLLITEELKSFRSYFDKLTPQARKLVELVVDENLSLKEIAEESGIAYNSLKKRYWEAGKILKKLAEEDTKK